MKRNRETNRGHRYTEIERVCLKRLVKPGTRS